MAKSMFPSFKKVQQKMNFLMKPNNMNKVLILLAILLVLYLVHHFLLSKEGFESSAEELEQHVGEKQKSMVLFYADWCGHCKQFMPEWDKISNEINEVQENVKLIKVNCGDPQNNKTHKKIMDTYSIQGYPTIKVIENGNAKEYDGDRTSSGIKSYLGI